MAFSAAEQPNMMPNTPLLSIQNLVKQFPLGGGLFSGRRATVHAVQDVSFDINRGETLGLVGESGSGKSTIGRTIVGLERPTSGRILLDGVDIGNLSEREFRRYRRRVQMIFQDPYSSLDPRMSAGQIIEEPLVIQGVLAQKRKRRVSELLDLVGLTSSARHKLPHEFSGGQRQRMGIARAIALNPDVVIADEPVSALDVSIQAQIINLLEDLQTNLSLSYLFIGHDLSVVRHLAHHVAVLYLGRVMEIASRDALYGDPCHPYTIALLQAAPIPDPKIEASRSYHVIEGEIPSPVHPPPGCVFSSRCELASEECTREIPPFVQVAPGHHVACIKIPEAKRLRRALNGGESPREPAGQGANIDQTL